MRLSLWPELPEDLQWGEMKETLGLPDIRTVLVLVRDEDTSRLGGFAEIHIRKRLNSPHEPLVAYLEGWYVDPDLRGQGQGRALMAAAEDWARSHGLPQMASDTEIANQQSIQAHQALGFQEVHRLVHFLKDL